MKRRILITGALGLAVVQLLEAIRPGLISGPVNLGVVWLVVVVGLIVGGISTSPTTPDRPDQS